MRLSKWCRWLIEISTSLVITITLRIRIRTVWVVISFISISAIMTTHISRIVKGALISLRIRIVRIWSLSKIRPRLVRIARVILLVNVAWILLLAIPTMRRWLFTWHSKSILLSVIKWMPRWQLIFSTWNLNC